MKKLLLFVLVIIGLTIITGTVALASDGSNAGAPEFYTWAMLATSGGCLLATLGVTQFVKPIWPQKIPTQYLSYLIALIVLLLANVFMGTFSLDTAVISVFNAVVIALAANGAFNNGREMKDKILNTGGDPEVD